MRDAESISTGADFAAWAVQALVDGYDSPALRKLAGLSVGTTASRFEAKALFDRAVEELGLLLQSSQEELLRTYVSIVAREVLANTRSVSDALQIVHRRPRCCSAAAAESSSCSHSRRSGLRRNRTRSGLRRRPSTFSQPSRAWPQIARSGARCPAMDLLHVNQPLLLTVATPATIVYGVIAVLLQRRCVDARLAVTIPIIGNSAVAMSTVSDVLAMIRYMGSDSLILRSAAVAEGLHHVTVGAAVSAALSTFAAFLLVRAGRRTRVGSVTLGLTTFMVLASLGLVWYMTRGSIGNVVVIDRLASVLLVLNVALCVAAVAAPFVPVVASHAAIVERRWFVAGSRLAENSTHALRAWKEWAKPYLALGR